MRLMIPAQPLLMAVNAASFCGETNPSCTSLKCVPLSTGVSVMVSVESSADP